MSVVIPSRFGPVAERPRVDRAMIPHRGCARQNDGGTPTFLDIFIRGNASLFKTAFHTFQVLRDHSDFSAASGIGQKGFRRAVLRR